MDNSASLDEINLYIALRNPRNYKCSKAYVRIDDGRRPRGFGKALNPKFGSKTRLYNSHEATKKGWRYLETNNKAKDLFLLQERMNKMKNVKRFLLALFILNFIALPALVLADSPEYSTVGVGGYDPVAYFKEGKAIKGNGWHVAYHKDVTYVFANKMNRKMFEADPEKYLPAYGGYCAYGVAVGKKFVADPEVWKIVEGILYFNLDKDIQSKWAKDIPGYIKKADANWPKILGKAPADL